MHLHYLTLERQVDYLAPLLEGARIADSYTQRKNEWVLVLHREDRPSGCLHISVDGQYPCILFLDVSSRARNSTDIMPDLNGQSFGGVHLFPGDRVVSLALAGQDQRLLVQLFTHRANVFRVDGEGRIVDSFKAARQWRGQYFDLSEGDAPDPRALSPEAFAARVVDGDADTVAAALKPFPLLRGPVRKEVLHRSGLDGERPAAALDTATLQHLHRAILEFSRDCRRGTPVIYRRNGLVARFAPAPLQHLGGYEMEEVPDINQALRRFCFQATRQRGLQQARERYGLILQRKERSLTHHLRRLGEAAAPDPEAAARWRRIGQLIASQPQLVGEGSETVTLIDYYDPEMPQIEVAVDPTLSAQENARRYFHKAEQCERQDSDLEERRKDLERRIAAINALREDLETADGPKALRKLEAELKTLRLLQPEREESEQFRLPYRRYEFQGYEIRVGRSARDNDLLTFRHAGGDDLWLHAQGYAGSHVVIANPSRGEPPEAVKIHAARLAATNSAARHASYVPVMVTRVKYVRKPRKSAPGSVETSRYKTLFVDPLPG